MSSSLLYINTVAMSRRRRDTYALRAWISNVRRSRLLVMRWAIVARFPTRPMWRRPAAVRGPARSAWLICRRRISWFNLSTPLTAAPSSVHWQLHWFPSLRLSRPYVRTYWPRNFRLKVGTNHSLRTHTHVFHYSLRRWGSWGVY